ncbi:MAG TPA: HAD family phosphatase [Terriglobia bacterium]|nr:HAD family phosphatase [Terriglobia bacterium]
MPKITAVFSDVGGVLLTNGWDHNQRARLVEKFGLDARDFEDRHQMLSAGMDAGQLDLDQYLDRTIFYRPRPFRKQEVRDFIYAQSEAFPDSLAIIERLAQADHVFLATLNNESRELNLFRIEKFGLRQYFSVFFSSCYLGVSKPHPQIYQLALDLSQRQPEECVFIDDRSLNLECARRLGLHTIQFLNAGQLEGDLHTLGLEF